MGGGLSPAAEDALLLLGQYPNSVARIGTTRLVTGSSKTKALTISQAGTGQVLRMPGHGYVGMELPQATEVTTSLKAKAKTKARQLLSVTVQVFRDIGCGGAVIFFAHP